jgi:ubiquinone/menaquinone biosynthesis C-methylase UbiE
VSSTTQERDDVGAFYARHSTQNDISLPDEEIDEEHVALKWYSVISVFGKIFWRHREMAFIGGRLAAAVLSRYEWHDLEARAGYSGAGKIDALFGPEFWPQIKGKTVIDFGCGHGDEAIEIARRGAARSIGLEMMERYLQIGRENLARSGVKNCDLLARTDEQVDIILSLDSFEHFQDPGAVLKEMARLLKPDGQVIVSFGYPWYHPLGGHFPLFPWAHVILTERSLMKWRAQYKTDGAKRFGEVEGGLNQMSIRKFERTVSQSPLTIKTMKAVPIRHLKPLHCHLTRELLTSVVQAVLVHRGE